MLSVCTEVTLLVRVNGIQLVYLILGETNSGADAFKKYDGTVDVTIEAID